MGPVEVAEKTRVDHVRLLRSDQHLSQKPKLNLGNRSQMATLLNLDPGETVRADKTVVGVRKDDNGASLRRSWTVPDWILGGTPGQGHSIHESWHRGSTCTCLFNKNHNPSPEQEP